MYSCFIICPIGESGSTTRENADDLRDLIIQPALEIFGFDVQRGDHHSDAGQIDIDVIRAVQESDLCVIDISEPNPNVYYELGRRDETGKPLVLLKSKDSGELPVDIATRRYIEYDLDDRRGIRDAVIQLKSFVEPMVKSGFASNGSGASLLELSEILKRVERKIDRIESKHGTGDGGGTIDPNALGNADPTDVFRLAVRQRNIPMAEKAMEVLSYRMNKPRWLDQVVEQVAVMGSVKAGDILAENALEFMDGSSTFHEKIEYLGCLVSNLNKTDREREYMKLVEEICAALQAISAEEPAADRVQVNNQLNRMYYGIYLSTKDAAWLEKAIGALEKSLEISDQFSFLWYNLALCFRKRNTEQDKKMALEYVLRSIELDGEKQDDDHLMVACELLHEFDDPRLSDYMSKLESVNAVKAQLLRSRW